MTAECLPCLRGTEWCNLQCIFYLCPAKFYSVERNSCVQLQLSSFGLSSDELNHFSLEYPMFRKCLKAE